ncbi:MAG: class I SAM-dependent methyltransferase [Candidatus Binatia bacterium]
MIGSPRDLYGREFHDRYAERARRSARVIVPLLLEIVRPRSVVDVGCGVGSWLAVFREHGVEDVFGLDGEWMDPSRLQIPAACFRAADLARPPALERRFDLVVCLEVAEHLPETAERGFVDRLVELAPVVVFSAAIPFQGGEGHQNERWPEHWAELFEARNHFAVDCIRPRIWRNPEVDWWYAQNALLFVERGRLEQDERLRREAERTERGRLDLVHPERYLSTVDPERQSVHEGLATFTRIVRRALRDRLRRLSRSASGSRRA